MPHAMLVLLSALLLFRQSQPPPPTPAKATHKDQGKASPENPKTGPDQSPPKLSPSGTIQGVSEVASRYQQQTSTPRSDGPPADWWGRASTLLITLFTGALAWLAWRQWLAMDAQAKYMKDGLEETRKAADAAKGSADIARLALEPNVGVAFDLLADPLLNDDDDTLKWCRVQITATNTGQSSARSFYVESSFLIDGLDENFAVPFLGKYGPADLHPSKPMQMKSVPIEKMFPTAGAIGWQYVVASRHLTIYGFYEFRSVFGQRSRIGYKARVNPASSDYSSGRGIIGFEVESELAEEAPV